MQIVEKLKHLVASERKITAEIISLISEIEQKKIYAHLGYPSLFSFLTEHIGYAAASAQRRIEASRLLNQIPEIKEDLKSGALNLTQVSLVAQSVRQKIKEMPLVEFKSSDKKYLLDQIKNHSIQSSQIIIAKTLDLEIKATEKKSMQQDESVRLEITLNKDQMELVNKARALISHINPSATIAEVFEHLANDFIKRKDPARKVQGEDKIQSMPNSISVREVQSETSTSIAEVQQENETSIPATKRRSDCTPAKQTGVRKTIPAAVKRLVWRRDNGKCQHKISHDKSGKVCGSQYMLQIDHVRRVRHGGENHPNNLRLLCYTHNHLRG